MKTDSQAIARPPAISSLGLICAAQFVLQLDFSIVNVALPTIQRELGFTPADLQWVVTGYALTFGSLLLLGGRAGDLLGRRHLLMLGLLLFGLASLSCGLALSPLMLTLSRPVACRSLRIARRQQRERRGRDERRSSTLHKARQDQHERGEGQATGQRGKSKECQPQHEQASTPQQVTGAPTQQQE